jgi:hypothetical protein
MTCDQALELMLDAELMELSAAAPTPLGAHLRDCGWCRRVGLQLVDDTQHLASAMALPVDRRSRWKRRAHESVPATLAAGILVMLTIQLRQETFVGQVPRVLPAVVVSPASPAVPDEPVAPPAVKTSRPRLLKAFPAAQPIAAVEMALQAPVATPPALVASNAVTVTPPAGTRAVVMQTSDPKLVVVWLYDPEEFR